jgi:hypothetical protein
MFMTYGSSDRLFAKIIRCMFLGLILLTGTEGRRLLAQVSVTIPRVSVLPGATVSIPVKVGDLSGKDVTSFEFVAVCDTNVLRLSGVDQEKTLSSGLTMFANNHVRPYHAGRMKVVCASSQPLAGSGVLVYITGIAQKRNGTSSLKMTNCILNTGLPPTSVSDGSITVRPQKGSKSAAREDSTMSKQ